MTNEKAREVLQEQIDRYGQEYDAEGIEALNMAIKVLEQTRWIPLNAKGSEPQKNGKYLVCFDDGYITAMYYENGEWWILNNQPIAWMPLPEPYKESEV